MKSVVHFLVGMKSRNHQESMVSFGSSPGDFECKRNPFFPGDVWDEKQNHHESKITFNSTWILLSLFVVLPSGGPRPQSAAGGPAAPPGVKLAGPRSCKSTPKHPKTTVTFGLRQASLPSLEAYLFIVIFITIIIYCYFF